MRLVAHIILLSGCASRIDAPESAISREARARWTMKQVREMNKSVEEWRAKR